MALHERETANAGHFERLCSGQEEIIRQLGKLICIWHYGHRNGALFASAIGSCFEGKPARICKDEPRSEFLMCENDSSAISLLIKGEQMVIDSIVRKAGPYVAPQGVGSARNLKTKQLAKTTPTPEPYH